MGEVKRKYVFLNLIFLVKLCSTFEISFPGPAWPPTLKTGFELHNKTSMLDFSKYLPPPSSSSAAVFIIIIFPHNYFWSPFNIERFGIFIMYYIRVFQIFSMFNIWHWGQPVVNKTTNNWFASGSKIWIIDHFYLFLYFPNFFLIENTHSSRSILWHHCPLSI